MPLRTIATFAVAILLGLIAVVLINVYMGGGRKPANVAQNGQPTTVGAPVVVAASPITRGTVVQPQMLKVVNYPAGSVPTGAFTKITDLVPVGVNKDTQRTATRDLGVDEPVLATRVTAPGVKLSLATELTPGMQAITFRTNDVAGVAGFVLPNDRVDILLSRAVGGKQITQVIAENVRVLGVDQVDDQESKNPIVVKAITIEVTPEQSQQLTLAPNVGQVSLALRHVQDVAPVTRMATTQAVFGFSEGRPARRRSAIYRAAPSLPTVRVTRATDTTVYQVSAR